MPTLSTFVLEVIVFTVLLFFLVFVWFGPLSIIAYRRRRNRRRDLEAQQQEQQHAAQSDVEKGLALSTADECDAAAAVPGCQPRPSRSSAPVSAFLRWRQRVLYQSDSLSELAVLPWYRREESASRRVLNFVLRKQSAQQPEPPTIASVRRAVEAHDASLSGDHAPPMLPHIPRIPEIVVHCVCSREQFAIADQDQCPSCSFPRSRPPLPSMFLPGSASSCFHSGQTAPLRKLSQDSRVSSTNASPGDDDASSRRFEISARPSVDGNAGAYRGRNDAQPHDQRSPNPGKMKTFIVVVPASPAKGEKTALDSEGDSGAHHPLPAVDLSPYVLRLAPTFSTTSSLVDLLLEAIAADSDASDAASSSPSSSSSSSSSTISISPRSSRSDDEYDDSVSEVLSLYYSDMEDNAGHSAGSRGSRALASDDGTSWRASRSSLTSSADLDAQVRTGWRASLGRIWAAHGVNVTVLST
ncbi:hypothetical protein K466DRAFT_662457 [Polyporus arcularius HHB13444]|uniref:Uncharacterized protein n=1 Tax=Polyporus arcularius HHB13444 TaxID=1314778 RepID=A0A5C3PES8_9APHY|nr:hypothetical protein K466DRAFT_662457 [Polyporus arcularius HHB13444]